MVQEVKLSFVKPMNIIANSWFSIAADFLHVLIKFADQSLLILFPILNFQSWGGLESILPELGIGISTKAATLAG